MRTVTHAEFRTTNLQNCAFLSKKYFQTPPPAPEGHVRGEFSPKNFPLEKGDAGGCNFACGSQPLCVLRG